MFDKTPTEIAVKIADAALDATFEWIVSQPAELAELAFSEDGPLRLSICDIGFANDLPYPPLSVLIQDFETDAVLGHFDILGTIAQPLEEHFTDYEKRRVTQAITALQSGLDKMKSYLAEREATQ